MAIGEAMACGVPCVVTDVGDSSFLVDRTGTASPARDPQKLAAAMLDLLGRGDGGRRALGLAARQRILRHFSIDAVAERYLDLYSTTLRASRVRRVKQCAA
jgi:glycosyltransferase involved in cell wall biosynthesis